MPLPLLAVTDRLLDPQAVAHRLYYSVDHVRRLLRSGDLPAIRLASGRWRVDPADLERYIDMYRISPTRAKAARR
jgi:excisionase family DNA binding protein